GAGAGEPPGGLARLRGVRPDRPDAGGGRRSRRARSGDRDRDGAPRGRGREGDRRRRRGAQAHRDAARRPLPVQRRGDVPVRLCGGGRLPLSGTDASLPPASRVAVVNRGDAALRAIRAIREYNYEHGADVVAIALHSEEEAGATFVREADEAVSLGPAFTASPDGTRRLAYVDEGVLGAALRRARPGTAWVGWGFVAERPECADLCDRLGVRLVGPSGEVMRRLGDKVGAKLLAESVDVPVVPWSGGPVADADAAARHAERIGYPPLIKAAARGGGRGIRRVDRPGDLAGAFNSAGREPRSACGAGPPLLARAGTTARPAQGQGR